MNLYPRSLKACNGYMGPMTRYKVSCNGCMGICARQSRPCIAPGADFEDITDSGRLLPPQPTVDPAKRPWRPGSHCGTARVQRPGPAPSSGVAAGAVCGAGDRSRALCGRPARGRREPAGGSMDLAIIPRQLQVSGPVGALRPPGVVIPAPCASPASERGTPLRAGGARACSRWLSEATPPVARPFPPHRTPTGCRHLGQGAGPYRSDCPPWTPRLISAKMLISAAKRSTNVL
jgi:hypothetical protein